MARLSDQIEALVEQISSMEARAEKKRKELFELEAELKGLKRALEIISPYKTEKTAPARVSLKSKILDMLYEVGCDGLNSSIAVEMANSRGEELKRESISSILSKLVKSGDVVHTNNRYILRQHYNPNFDESEIDMS